MKKGVKEEKKSELTSLEAQIGLRQVGLFKSFFI